MKKLLNDPQHVVVEMLDGMAAAHPDLLRIDREHRLVLRAVPKQDGKVAVVSGGGSGHEPMHAGLVGTGLLDAACIGEVFTSPVPDQVLAAITECDRGAGVLLVVTNYAGDVMNFEMAAELAEMSGIQVRTVVVADDVGTLASASQGRRGTGATLVVEKVAAAAAEAGLGLDECWRLAQQVADNSRSMGLALTSCTVPAVGRPTFELGGDEMSLGVGIHGEKGREPQPLTSARTIASMLTRALLADLDYAGHDVICLVNGLGATPLMELYVLLAEVAKLLQSAGVGLTRTMVGQSMTSLDMAGATLTLVRSDESVLGWWDAEVHTAAWRWGC